ncbi:MAG TPA: hypothetical protein VIG06_23355 [Kofleriaceae bacterium]
MNIFSRLLARFGYVRLKDYGYALSPGGKIVEVVQVDDDRFAPPPWQPLGWQSATSLLPPAPAGRPSPRPLPPPPDAEADEEEPAPLFRVPGVPATVETAPPGDALHEEVDVDEIGIDEESIPEDEEWEWKMALARAREAADKERARAEKGKETAAVRPVAAPASSPAFRTSALPLSPPPASPRKVVESPRPMSRIARPEPRPGTDRPVAAKTTPRTVPPKAPPGSKSRQMAAARPEPEKTPARSSLEKSVSRVFSPASPSTGGAAGKARPLPRLARGTESPARDGRPTQPRMALGSGRLPAVRDPSHDVTATDITAVDRAEASMRSDEEDTRVNVVLPPSAEITLDIGVDCDPEVENTMVDSKPNGVAIVSVADGSSPLPRLTARLRRHSVSN